MGVLNPLTDPYQGIFFKVIFSGPVNGSAAFSKISGLSEETEAAEYRTGDDPPVKRMLAGLTTFGDVTFEDGMDPDDSLRKWRQMIVKHRWPSAIEKRSDVPSHGAYKGRVEIILEGRDGAPIHRFALRNAWPFSVEYGDVDAMSSDVIIRSVSFKHEGLLEKFEQLTPESL